MVKKKIINDEIRDSLPGSTADLTDGSVYYELDGPEHGKVIVLIHGMSIPSFLWDPTWGALIGAGYRVLRYDLFGRGYSDRPRVTHNLQLYERQLLELLAVLDFADHQISLVGFSLGAAICAAFASKHQERTRSLSLIEPIHPDDMPPAPFKIFKTLIRIQSFAARTDQGILAGLPKNFYKYEDFPDFEAAFREQLRYRGLAEAVIGTLVDFKFAALPDIYEAVGRLNIPISLLWGAEDKVSPLESSEVFKRAIPGVQFHAVENAGHIPHYERPDLVNPILIEFLRNQQVGTE